MAGQLDTVYMIHQSLFEQVKSDLTTEGQGQGEGGHFRETKPCIGRRIKHSKDE